MNESQEVKWRLTWPIEQVNALKQRLLRQGRGVKFPEDQLPALVAEGRGWSFGLGRAACWIPESDEGLQRLTEELDYIEYGFLPNHRRAPELGGQLTLEGFR